MKTIAVVFSSLIIAAISTFAYAGYPMAVANNDYVQVDIRLGNDNLPADQMSVHYQGRATKGQSWRGGEGQRICARREGYPGSANSGFSTWQCVSSYSGIQVGIPSKTDF